MKIIRGIVRIRRRKLADGHSNLIVWLEETSIDKGFHLQSFVDRRVGGVVQTICVNLKRKVC